MRSCSPSQVQKAGGKGALRLHAMTLSPLRAIVHRFDSPPESRALLPLPVDQLALLTMLGLAFAAGYGLRAFISHRRRRRWN